MEKPVPMPSVPLIKTIGSTGTKKSARLVCRRLQGIEARGRLAVEELSSDRVQLCEDVSGRGRVFTAHQPGSKLSARYEQRDIVRTDEIVRQSYDRVRERYLTVVIARFSDTYAANCATFISPVRFL